MRLGWLRLTQTEPMSVEVGEEEVGNRDKSVL